MVKGTSTLTQQQHACEQYLWYVADAFDDEDALTSGGHDESLALPQASAGHLRPGIVHRLDKGTTGQSATVFMLPCTFVQHTC